MTGDSIWWLLVAPGLAAAISMLYALGWCWTTKLTIPELLRVSKRCWGAFATLGALDAVRAACLAALVSTETIKTPLAPTGWTEHLFSWGAVGAASFFLSFRVPPAVSFIELKGDGSTADDGAPAQEGSSAGSASRQVRGSLYRPGTGFIYVLRREAVRRITEEAGLERQSRVQHEVGEVDHKIEVTFPGAVSRSEYLSVLYQVQVYLDSAGEILGAERARIEEYLGELHLDAEGRGPISADYRANLRALFERLMKAGLQRLCENILTGVAGLRDSSPPLERTVQPSVPGP